MYDNIRRGYEELLEKMDRQDNLSPQDLECAVHMIKGLYYLEVLESMEEFGEEDYSRRSYRSPRRSGRTGRYMDGSRNYGHDDSLEEMKHMMARLEQMMESKR